MASLLTSITKRSAQTSLNNETLENEEKREHVSKFQLLIYFRYAIPKIINLSRILLFILRSALFMLFLLTILFFLYDNLLVFPFLSGLDLPTESEASEQTSPFELPRYTVFMVSKNRIGYMESMIFFVSKLDPSRGRFILFDIESDTPLSLPQHLSNLTNVQIIRKEPHPSSTSAFHQKGLKFSIWESWAFAIKHIHTDRVFYFDNCNYPENDFDYDEYTDDNYYFNNNERFYTQNFSTKKRTFYRFLSELPPHLIRDRRSFFGGDQLLIWYLNSKRVANHFQHIKHEELAAYNQWNPHSIIIWRIWLYMNRYSNPENNGLGNQQHHYCNDKKVLCAHGALLQRLLRLPVVYHFADSLLRLEYLFAPVPLITNFTNNNWFIGFFIMGIINILLFACWWNMVVFFIKAFAAKGRNRDTSVVQLFNHYVFSEHVNEGFGNTNHSL